ncbi:MAG: peptide-methionine (S)-S-oxide reductase MsrA [Xanthomonadaceae bacterium]|nr:peptide-methionine (S)-S-oxide reductase MsrA [Silanimonas sp.]MBS3896406.1 peptide-methionine (S)-S-oxide reductase MsrA [Silanimonas sp.]MBS3924510.1 peptide-methionine (S)-S-oxide reductase MsrA [Xanthomonadaceae bacterium]
MVERALLAGGCFWGLQELLRRQPGVRQTRVGYSGGERPKPSYRDHERHAETVELYFDPAVLGYRELLACFFRLHDPTTPNRQGNDIGPSYRSAVFALDERQRQGALAVIAAIEASGRWPGRVVTEVVPAGPFWLAEPEHQDYLQRHPGGYSCHWERPDWVLPPANWT